MVWMTWEVTVILHRLGLEAGRLVTGPAAPNPQSSAVLAVVAAPVVAALVVAVEVVAVAAPVVVVGVVGVGVVGVGVVGVGVVCVPWYPGPAWRPSAEVSVSSAEYPGCE
jgi:hypothetical protein